MSLDVIGRGEQPLRAFPPPPHFLYVPRVRDTVEQERGLSSNDSPAAPTLSAMDFPADIDTSFRPPTRHALFRSLMGRIVSTEFRRGLRRDEFRPGLWAFIRGNGQGGVHAACNNASCVLLGQRYKA